MSARGNTPLPELAARLRQLADWAEQGRLSGLSVIGLDAEPRKSVTIVHTPSGQNPACALFGGLVTNACITAMAAGIDLQQAARIIADTINELKEERP